jgi:hypothetical protein
MREFIKDGTWDATAVLFARTFTYLKDEGDQMGDTEEELSCSPNPLLKQAPSPSEPLADYTRICGLDLVACRRPFLDRIQHQISDNPGDDQVNFISSHAGAAVVQAKKALEESHSHPESLESWSDACR